MTTEEHLREAERALADARGSLIDPNYVTSRARLAAAHLHAAELVLRLRDSA